MKRGLLVSLCFVLNVLFISLYAQEDKSVLVQDTAQVDFSNVVFLDTLSTPEIDQMSREVKLKPVEDFQPSPGKAVLYSAIFPGLGQIYNRKYWKLPIVYGGFLGVVYAVTWNGNMYTDYKNGYSDIMTDPEKRTRWHDFVGGDPLDIIGNSSEFERVKGSLKRNRDYYRRNRDLAIIVGVGLYALCMIDAYVDAQLYNFTITPDLSMTVAPVVWGPSQFSKSATVGFQCNIVF